MQHFFPKVAVLLSVIVLAGCTARVVHTEPGPVVTTPATTEEVIIGGEPLYDVWPTHTFYYDNWGVYGGGGHYHHHHHHHGHH